ncbi:Ger(x)C family spore germination protein [Salipaludibacillus sp. CUR1]|uniref:Ger(x)C family spore germination protein n=1 Tax=Salipaludibacillus sp. CUR1 TaxID=2820003 RepID=UPI001E581751|nr:Ger(x)C family spore germination protein [Salipaludibacillus sp. CUR1]MCE7791930.1 Ger(x)C family spore germination protein [Salipaludibacillus sp. CUR1]
MKKICMSFFLFILLLTGCLNANELERMYYVHAAGLDYEDGEFIIYLQILNFSTIAKEMEQTEEEADTIVGIGRGRTPVTAIHDLYKSTPQRLFWGHMAAVVFSEDALENGLNELLDDFLRFSEIRHTPWIFSTIGDVSPVLEVYPFLDASPILGTLGDPMDSYEQSSYVEPLRKHRFIADLNEPGKSANIPSLDISERWTTENASKRSLHLAGTTVIYGEDYRGTLENLDMVGLRWVQPNTQRTPVIVTKDDKPAAVIMMKEPDYSITSHVENEDIFFEIEVDAGGGVIELDQEVSEDFINSEAAKVIEKEIRLTYEKALEIEGDVYQLNNELYKENPHEWHEHTTDGALELTKESLREVQVNVHIEHSGKNKLFPALTDRHY